MKVNASRRLLAAIIALLMVVQLMPTTLTVAAAESKTYILDTTTDLVAMEKGAKADGDTETAGTDGYFTIHYSKNTKIDSSEKTFSDGYAGTQRLNFGGKYAIGETTKNVVGITTSGAATVKIWWVANNDGREMGIFDATGQLLKETAENSTKSGLYISELTVEDAGSYFIGCTSTEGCNYIFKIEVTESAGEEGGDEPVEEPVTLWDFTLDEYAAGQTEYNGLVISSSTNAPGKNTSGYGLSLRNSVISVPVSGPCAVVVSVGYQWDVTFPDGTNEAVTSGDGGKITVYYNHTGEAGTVDLTVGNTCTTYISKIELTEPVEEEEPATSWDFSEEAFVGGGYTGGSGTYNGLRWTNGKSHNNTYLYSGSGTITVPVSGPCTVAISACYEYSFYFEAETEASVGVSTGSTSQIDTYTYNYTGEAGEVVITVLGGSYITKIEVTEPVEEEEPATSWDFSEEAFVGGGYTGGSGTYNGLRWTNGKSHNGVYLYSGSGTITVPVSGPCTVVISACYEYSFYFEAETEASVGVSTGSTSQIDTYTYNYTGEAGEVVITVLGGSYITKIEVTELVEEEVPATSWDFSEEAFVGGGYAGGSGTYNGLRWTNGKSHNGVYLYSGSGTITVPVSGPCTVAISACYEYSFYFEAETEASVGVSTGSTSQIDTYTYNYTGEAGEVVITVLGGSYITKIELGEPIIEEEEDEVPDLEPGKIYVWDFGAEALEGEQYVNMLTVDEINSWFKDVEPGTTGKNIASFTSSDGLLRFEDGGKPGTHRLRSTNTALTRYDDKSLTDADGNVYTGYIYSNSSSTNTVYVAIMVNAGEKVTLVVGSNGGNSLINFESPSGVVAQQEFLSSGAKAQILTFYPTESGEYKIYSTTEKLVLARIYREAPAEVTVTGTVTAPGELTDYAIVFTNTASGAVVTAPVSNGTYAAVLHEGYSYELSLADANGYIITSETTLTVASGSVCDIVVEPVELVTVTGTFAGIAESALANLKLSFQADAIYIPEVTVSGNTYTAKLEKGVTYTVVAEGVNDYVLASETSVTYNEDATANIVFEAKPTYAVTIDPVGATLADLANATFVFTNLKEEGYVYTFVGAENISLRDGVYSVKVTGVGGYVQKRTSNLTVSGGAVTKTIEFEVPTSWDFSAEDFAGTSPYNGLVFSKGQKNKTYLLANTGTISVPVSGPCKIVVSACYQYSFYFASEDEASVDQKTNSTSQIDSFEYIYTGEAGFVDITVLGQSYITKIEIVEAVAYAETITVGAEGCDYTTINAALNAVKAMARPNNERVTILIQPGNYEEMLVVDVPNVTLKNASDNPSIELTNKGVDIDENAVRITWYYGHGYTYYSMGADCKFDAELLEINKQNGYPSFENPGAGTTNGSYWNATVVIFADGFQAEGIIFENSFNQYISAAAANDIIVAQGSAKEGSVPRNELGVYSTAVQDKAYVERATALAVADNCNEVYFENCKFVGRQDTLYGGKGATVAFYDCAVYGGTDYIFGAMTAVFAKCDLVFNTSEDTKDVGYITAAQQTSGRGYLMYNCTITSTTPGVDTASEYTSKPGYFGRPWAANTAEVVFYMTNIEATCSNWYSISASLIRGAGWLDSLSGESALVGEYGTYEIAEGVDNSASRVAWANVFETEHLADGTPITVEAFLGDWDPFAGKDMTIVMSTEKVNNNPNQEEDDGDDSQDTPTEGKTYILESSDLDPVAPGEKADGETQIAGTEDFFTIIYGVKTKVDSSKKTFDDGYQSEQRINFQGKTTSDMYYSIKFTTDGPAVIKLWWVSGGDDRQFAIYDENGDILCRTNEEALKNETYISELTVDAAGTYYIGLPDGSNYLFKAEVTVSVAQSGGDDIEKPDVNPEGPDTGDGVVMVCLMMAFSALALVVLLPNKKRMF